MTAIDVLVNRYALPHRSGTAGLTKAQRTKLRLRLAGLRVLVRSGFNDMHIKTVAKEAKTSVGTFYLYYPDKAALAREIVLEWWEESVKFVYSGKHFDDPFEAILDANRRYVQGFVRAGNLNLAAAQMIDTIPDVREEWQRWTARTAELLASAMTRRSRQSARYGRTRLFVAYALQAMVDTILLAYFARGDSSVIASAGSPEELVEGLSILWFRALYGRDPDAKHLTRAKSILTLRLEK